MIGNDRFGRSDLLPSECERLFRDRAYGIDVIKINAFQFIYAGINVPWHGDIDDEERTIQALPQHRREYLGCQQRRFRCCRREQNVDLTALRRPIIERHGAPTYGLRQLARAIQRAITDPKIGDATRDKRTCRALASFTCAEHKNFAIAQFPENSLRKINGDRSNRDETARNVGVSAHVLGHPKSALKQTMQIWASRLR